MADLRALLVGGQTDHTSNQMQGVHDHNGDHKARHEGKSDKDSLVKVPQGQPQRLSLLAKRSEDSSTTSHGMDQHGVCSIDVHNITAVEGNSRIEKQVCG